MLKRLNPMTMVEILVVLTLIAILSGLLMSGLGTVTDKGAAVDTKKRIFDIQAALNKYYISNSSYPSSGTLSYNDLAPFGDFPKDSYNASNIFIDGYEQPIGYFLPPYSSPAKTNVNMKSYQLISKGADGKYGNDDDITNF
ncbi:MAG: type II secretion system protein [Planctomycetes bacterium]|nr:type II secretion system protein [Planctomycetota bacterium]